MLKVCLKYLRGKTVLAFFVVVYFALSFGEVIIETPKFGEAIGNVTAPLGREAILNCIVDNLRGYKVAWLRVDTQTILTIAGHVITKNHRISVTQADKRAWRLHIKELREADRGWYMCQLNTEPMRSQTGYLEVVVPPDIVDAATSSDVVVKEGASALLACAARGSPQPSVTWRRENSRPLPLPNGTEALWWEGGQLVINKTSRLHAGAYLCIASNGVPPSVSKRVTLNINFPPMIWIQNQLVGAIFGQSVSLECHSEASPRSINYWSREKGEVLADNEKYQTSVIENGYKILMKLKINDINQADLGMYKCVSKNSLGDTDGTIKVYGIPTTTTSTTTTTTTVATTTVTRVSKKLMKSRHNTIMYQMPTAYPDIRNITSTSTMTIFKDVGSTISHIDWSPRKTSLFNISTGTTLFHNLAVNILLLITNIIFSFTWL